MKFKIDKLNFQIKLTIEKWTEPMSTVAIYIYTKESVCSEIKQV